MPKAEPACFLLQAARGLLVVAGGVVFAVMVMDWQTQANRREAGGVYKAATTNVMVHCEAAYQTGGRIRVTD